MTSSFSMRFAFKFPFSTFFHAVGLPQMILIIIIMARKALLPFVKVILRKVLYRYFEDNFISYRTS